MSDPLLEDALDVLVSRGLLSANQAALLRAGEGIEEANGEEEGAAARPSLARRIVNDDGTYVPALLGAVPTPSMTFESFVPCPKNAFACRLGRAFAAQDGPLETFTPLYVYGNVGTGKTHLLTALAQSAAVRRVLLLSAEDLEAEAARAAHHAARAELRRWVAGHDMVLIDDLHLGTRVPAVERELCAIVSLCERWETPLAVTADTPPEELPGASRRLQSLLSGGVIAAIQVCDAEDRAEVARRVLAGVEAPAEAITYLATHADQSMRQLVGAVRQLAAISEVMELPGGVDLARAIIPLPEDLAGYTDDLRGAAEPREPRAEEEALGDTVDNAMGQATEEPLSQPQGVAGPASQRTGDERAHAPRSDPEGETEAVEPPAMFTEHAGQTPASGSHPMRERFKEMLREADTPAQQALALQIALGERIRELRATGREGEVAPLEEALELVRAGRTRQALERVAT